MGLVRTLVDRIYKINNSWLGFHKDIKDLTLILRKNLFPVRMAEKVINRYVSRAIIRPSASSQVQQAVSTYYFKLPYVGSFTREAQKRLRKLVQRYCTNIKVGSMFSVKDPVPLDLRSRVVYKFLCAGCNACYIGETSRHLSTRVREHLSRDRNSHVYQHLQQSQACRCLANKNCCNWCNAGNGRGVRTCTSVLRLLACYSLQFDASKNERSTQIFFVGRLFARGKKKSKEANRSTSTSEVT